MSYEKDTKYSKVTVSEKEAAAKQAAREAEKRLLTQTERLGEVNKDKAVALIQEFDELSSGGLDDPNVRQQLIELIKIGEELAIDPQFLLDIGAANQEAYAASQDERDEFGNPKVLGNAINVLVAQEDKDKIDEVFTDKAPEISVVGGGGGLQIDPNSPTGWVDGFGNPVSPINPFGEAIKPTKGVVFEPEWLSEVQTSYSTAGDPTTLSFNEPTKGWVSFKSYDPESSVTVNNHYYTFKRGSLWQHHVNPNRCMFYGSLPGDDERASVTIIFNDAPSSVKNFQTIKYEGSQSKINKFSTVRLDGVDYTDKEYYNLNNKEGWFVEYAETDLATGKVPEFINKEGKWFNRIFGECTNLQNLDEHEFQVQGIGFATEMIHSDPDSEAPEPKRITVKDSSISKFGINWD